MQHGRWQVIERLPTSKPKSGIYSLRVERFIGRLIAFAVVVMLLVALMVAAEW